MKFFVKKEDSLVLIDCQTVAQSIGSFQNMLNGDNGLYFFRYLNGMNLVLDKMFYLTLFLTPKPAIQARSIDLLEVSSAYLTKYFRQYFLLFLHTSVVLRMRAINNSHPC